MRRSCSLRLSPTKLTKGDKLDVDVNAKGVRRIFVIAFACEPGRGSEPGVGYNFAEALARLSNSGRHEIVLLTRPHTVARVRTAIGDAVGQHCLTIMPVAIPMWLVAVTKRKRVRLAYVVWQAMAVRQILRMSKHLREPFAVHHVTFATEALPTFENLLGRNARLVFGPAGSSQEINEAEGGGWRTRLRGVVRKYFGIVNLRATTLAVASNDSAAKAYSDMGASRIVVEPNIVVDSAAVMKASGPPAGGAFPNHELICVGLLQERKRINMAIEALSLLKDQDIRLLIVGNGPLLEDLHHVAEAAGVSDRVTFAGKQTREATLSLMARSKVLVHPARQEGSGWVIGEAQSVGTIPVVIAGSGAETAVRLGGQGIVSANNTDSLAEAIQLALTIGAEPSGRWSESRLPGLLDEWYEVAISNS